MSNSQQIKLDLAQTIQHKKKEFLQDLNYLQRDLQEAIKELQEEIDSPTTLGINICGINQNLHTLDIKTGELAALIKLYRQF